MGAHGRDFVVAIDGEDVTVPRKRTRKTRNGGVKQETKEKFASVSASRKPLIPMNNKQKEYIRAVQEDSCVICVGVWGSSKTYIPSVIAADWLMDKKIDKVIIARPTEGKGKSIGFLKGDKNEKMECWCAPITDTMKDRMGVGNYEAMLANGRIELLNLEAVKGRSWDNCLTLVDEAEDLDPEVAKSLVGRQGVNSVTVITGDIAQQDLKRNSGLQYLLDVSEFANVPVTVIDFDSWDYCVRSEQAKAWGMAFEQYEKQKGVNK
jgi:phosphate starvation-inducible PhoH-like protein